MKIPAPGTSSTGRRDSSIELPLSWTNEDLKALKNAIANEFVNEWRDQERTRQEPLGTGGQGWQDVQAVYGLVNDPEDNKVILDLLKERRNPSPLNPFSASAKARAMDTLLEERGVSPRAQAVFWEQMDQLAPPLPNERASSGALSSNNAVAPAAASLPEGQEQTMGQNALNHFQAAQRLRQAREAS